MAIEKPRLQNLEEQMQSQNQKIQDLSAGLHRMEEMMSHRMEEMMSQMMELMKPSQGKAKEPVVPETQSNVNGTRDHPIEIGANSNEGRGILPLPKGKENGDSGNSSQGHKSSCNLRNSAMKLKPLGNLKLMDLSYSYNLIGIPDLSSIAPNLEFLYLKGCSSLVEIPSLQNLTKLTELDLSDCHEVKECPEIPRNIKF
ncbi:hypothetical protein GH714_021790 [Hevea brasiliensis]|uniref:Uncharacterized protein n=1 Tax=Hevea brasiliensis TaxID=3981 RepID=A0A6A6N552_HEVBR|nr:hypothetical protein GH714_021790 [Hevea brasiliensis]